MKVFLSWSGSKSREAADALKPWLAQLFDNLQVWMSDRDLEAGSPWGSALHAQLQTAQFGILLLSSENQSAPWILFEAGALAMSSKAGCVVPYLLDLDPTRLVPPLSLLQSARADKEGTWKLVRSIHQAQAGTRTLEDLQKAFEREWPAFADRLGITIRTELRADVLIVTPSAVHLLADDEVKALREKMKEGLRAGHKRIVVDMREVKRMTSAALSFILPGVTAGRKKEAEVVLANLSPQVRALFEETRMLAMVQVFATLEEAIAYYVPQSPK